MDKLDTLFDIAEFVKAHKDEILKDPESFKKTISLLSKAKKKRMDEEDFGDGFSIVDDPNEDFEDDDAAQWLKDHGKGREPEAPRKKGEGSATNWEWRGSGATGNHGQIDGNERNYYAKPDSERSDKKSEWKPKLDEADQWLKENESSAKDHKNNKQEAPENKSKKSYMSEWKPREDYSDKEKAEIEEHMKNGYSHREAERLAGAHKGHMDFRSAMNSGISPSMMSDKMMEQLKPLAKEWLDNADRHEKMKADPESNTVKRMSGKMMEAHEQHLGDYNKAYHDFLNSNELKEKKGRERHQAIQEWKGKWKQENPDFHEGVKQVSEAQRKFGYNQGDAKQSAQQRWDEIVGGKHMPTDMSESEALQHLGGGKSEEGYQGTIIKDPTAAFSERHKAILGKLSPEQAQRKNHVDTVATSQGVIRRRKGEG